MPSKANKRLQHAAKKAAEQLTSSSELVPALSSAVGSSDVPSANVNQSSPSPVVSTTADTPNSDGAPSSDITLVSGNSNCPSFGSSSPSQHEASPRVLAPPRPSAAPAVPNDSYHSLSIIATPKAIASSQERKNEADMDTYTPITQLPRISKSMGLGVETVRSNSHRCIIEDRNTYLWGVSIFKRDYKFEKEVGVVGVRKGKKKQGMLEIVQHALKKKNLEGFVAYDGAAILFTVQFWGNKEIQIEIDSVKDSLPDDFCRKHFPESHGYFRIVLKPSESESAVLKTMKLYDEKPENFLPAKRATMRMVQLVLTQEAKELGFTSTDQNSQIYNMASGTHTRPRVPGIIEVTGLSATLKVAEGEKKTEIHLIIDSKRSHFFEAGPLGNLQPFQSKTVDIKSAKSYLRDLHVETVYGFQNFHIEDLSEAPIEKIVTDDGTPLAEAAAKKSGRKHEDYNPKWPAVEVKFYDKENRKWKVFSHVVENLKVVAGQKVMKQHPPPQATSPMVRWTSSRTIARSCKILGRNEKLSKIGVEISDEPIDVEAVIFGNPKIHYRNDTLAQVNQKASWKPIDVNCRGGFVVTKTIEKIIIGYNSNERIGEAAAQVAQLRHALLGHAKSYGMHIKQIEVEDLAEKHPKETSEKAILKVLESLKNEKLIFIYADTSEKKTHELLKLGERIYEVPTQHLALDKSLQKIKHATVTNILYKLNVKSGGHNHKVTIDSTINELWGSSTKTLLFSYDVCHNSGKKSYSKGELCSEPSCVGFGYNAAANPEAIIGDFHYQEPRKEKVSAHILKERMRTAILMFAKHRGFPKNIVVIRDGVSDGQYAMVINYEQMAILEGIEEAKRLLRATGKPALAIIVATKRHDNRLFKKDPNGNMINARHLTVVDHTIVRQNLNEMIFLSHCPIIGTAQPILLNVLVNNNVFKTKEEIVKLITALCSTHQSSTNIISLPDTVFAADEYAKRGADIFFAFKEHFPNQMVFVDGKYDFEAMTKKLCYDKSIFRSLRII